ncbi:MAG: pectinesterase family protein, partial [Verrucomicrobiota bacterium]
VAGRAGNSEKMRRTILRGAFWLCGATLAAAMSACGSSSGGTGTGGKSGSTGGSAGLAATGGAAAGGSAGAATGGSAGATAGHGGGAGGGGGTVACTTPDGGAGAAGPTLAGTATRPLLSDADGARYTALEYLAQAGAIGSLTTDNWDPTAGVGDVLKLVPAYTVAADGTGTQTTVQAAITAAATAGGTARVAILVKPGTYREVVCVPKTAPPITLYGAGTDATAVTIVYNNYAGKPIDTNVNSCSGPSATSYGTSGSATFAAFAPGFQAKNLTFANDWVETTSGSNQAVALMTQGDQLIFENVRVLGNQDTLYVKTGSTLTVARAYFKASYVEGDVDFIFGRGTAVFDGCTLNVLTTRQGTKGGNYLAPSTAPGNPYGFLVTASTFTAETGTPANLIALGRAWDESVTCYMPGTSPNGQALVRDSVLGPQIRAANPWSPAATTSRPFSATANRLWELHNSGPGAAGGTTSDGGTDAPVK